MFGHIEMSERPFYVTLDPSELTSSPPSDPVLALQLYAPSHCSTLFMRYAPSHCSHKFHALPTVL
eukprot:5723234-Prymnesium_polylepis.1